ncbi:DUF2309 domain-containing protein [Thiohalophilus thiocyanatoxydans]|uniref:Probable inorganic carbon transporter subunit DabA n=1 Tax=Thiohalophilus thiocyanatoxydans TaxID=381308 RepID=A0A4R8IU21_9GAMM|nr:DUF2309 domain-containing protein [Thiohalophilus thiocyanatoxydans]TDY01119.1 hypothetical protein EDC23_1865 [Thiohalophilus thiocyanatoxydans]
MTLPLGQQLKIRTMIYVAGEPIPFFWPMRAFIHHNPLHGLEHLPFPEAVATGAQLFHGRGFLSRHAYQRYLAQGKVDRAALAAGIDEFVAQQPAIPGVDLSHWLMTLLTRGEQPIMRSTSLADAKEVHAAIHGREQPEPRVDPDTLTAMLHDTLLDACPLYDAVDRLYGTGIGAELDELVIKSCLDFFDEGQSVWHMPGRKQGLFSAWRELALRNARLFMRGLHIERILENEPHPEGVIASVMSELGIPEDKWVDCFSRELSRLHGWAGFIRWRANAKHYYWSQRYPADLVDFLAIRLTLALALLAERSRQRIATDRSALETLIQTRPRETWLRHELHSGAILPAYAQRVEQTLARGRAKAIEQCFDDYVRARRRHDAEDQAAHLCQLATRADANAALEVLTSDQLATLMPVLQQFEDAEGMLWLRAMEAQAMQTVLRDINLTPPVPRDKRPFAQALFCIDTRSERIRRHLESAGDYQTFGIAGFFGVPISFMELGKGSETHLCPVLLKPKNLVLEMTATAPADVAATTALEKVLHELKESVFTPYVTVEAIGMLFGFDMLGKTFLPQSYNRWRQRLYRDKPATHLLLDKLDREQADSIVRAVQRAVVGKAIEQEFELEPEAVTDEMVRELREAALGHATRAPALSGTLNLTEEAEQAFIQRLRSVYRIEPAFAQLQREQLARIGFSLDEQTNFVSQALHSIGLNRDFSRFILLVGHGSTSDNNPYESALDCGACGGNHGLINARVLAQMANQPRVRQRLRAQGIDIPDDAWFLPALHDTTTDEIKLFDLDRLPSSHVIYLDRLRSGLTGASRLCAQERLPELQLTAGNCDPAEANHQARRNAMDWSQVRPEWGLSGNAYFIIGRRQMTQHLSLAGRAFLHSYDYRADPKRRLLENILTGPLVVGQWINMEHYFSTVDNERFGSGSKVYHNVAGRFGVMTGNLSDLRTGLPAQTVLDQGHPYHQPIRLITVIEAPYEHARQAIEDVATVKNLVRNGWVRLLIIDPEQNTAHIYDHNTWQSRPLPGGQADEQPTESTAS